MAFGGLRATDARRKFSGRYFLDFTQEDPTERVRYVPAQQGNFVVRPTERVATGVITSAPFTAPHWNEAKSEREVPGFPWNQVYSSGRIIEGDAGDKLAVLLGQGTPNANGKAKGQQYGNAEHNRLVELEAMVVVRAGYEQEHWVVSDVSKDNLGWDLEARRGKMVRYIEVKGATGPKPEFFLTLNEYRATAEQDNWIAAVITDIFGGEPCWYEFEGADVLAAALPTQYRVICVR